jgi:hypothetical protein
LSEKNNSHGKIPSEEENNVINEDLPYEKLEKSGLNYISKQETYLALSLIFPAFLSMLQIFNIIFIVSIEADLPSFMPTNRFFGLLFAILSPLLFFFMISLFGIVMFIFLIRWNKKVAQYKNQRKIAIKANLSNHYEASSRKTITLTKIFYDIIDTMKTLRIMFLILNVICIYHFGWIIFFIFFRRLPSTEPFHPPRNFLSLSTAISQIILIIYLIYEWRHFYRWNIKFKLLRKLERKLYSELFQSNGL